MKNQSKRKWFGKRDIGEILHENSMSKGFDSLMSKTLGSGAIAKTVQEQISRAQSERDARIAKAKADCAFRREKRSTIGNS